MEYSNQEIPEGINTSREHPLKEFSILTAGVLGAIILIVFILSLLAEKLAVYVPFPVEQALIPDTFTSTSINNETTEYLQGLADKLAIQMELPKDMEFIVHYSEDPVENAYATLGGNIYLFRGLLEQLPTENAVSMVLAHEMAHIYHRHPIIAMGRGVVIGLLISAISGMSGDYFVGQVVSDTGLITLLKFNRDQEREADETALRMLVGLYGHTGGADDLFKLLQFKKDQGNEPYLFLSTHPLGDERIRNFKQYAEKNGWPVQGDLTPLPDIIQ